MAKRGRKPNNKRKGYFYEEEEAAIIAYLTSDDPIFREKIFMEKIYEVLSKMVESIIRRYKLYMPDEDYIDTFSDTLSFLLTKLDKFVPGKYKAYSYYGTICKNYLIGRLQAFSKAQMRNPLYSAVPGGFNSIKYSTQEGENNYNLAADVIEKLTKRLYKMIDEKDEIPLKESEVKLASALINLFENWDFILTTDGSPKLNKSAILFFLKDVTGLDAKGIRDNIKKFKKEFIIIKSILID